MKYTFTIPDCPKCGKEMFKDMKREFPLGWVKVAWKCAECGHEMDYNYEDEKKEME